MKRRIAPLLVVAAALIIGGACGGGPAPQKTTIPNGRPQVDAGYHHSCAVTVDGAVSCWGSNTEQQATPPAGSFTQVSAGNSHTCGLRTDGTLACWGNNTFLQATPPVGTFTQVSAGSGYSCGVRTDGTVACWGLNSNGKATPPAGTFTQVSAGYYGHTCGVKTDGAVACWGDDRVHQATPPTGAFTQVSAGTFHTCGLKADGTVVCWGDDSYGQATPPAGTFTQVSAGQQHTCGLKTAGYVACWGWNESGQTTPPGGTFTQVSAGDAHNCAVEKDGAVTCWGGNDFGQAAPPSALSQGRPTAAASRPAATSPQGTRTPTTERPLPTPSSRPSSRATSTPPNTVVEPYLGISFQYKQGWGPDSPCQVPITAQLPVARCKAIQHYRPTSPAEFAIPELFRLFITAIASPGDPEIEITSAQPFNGVFVSVTRMPRAMSEAEFSQTMKGAVPAQLAVVGASLLSAETWSIEGVEALIFRYELASWGPCIYLGASGCSLAHGRVWDQAFFVQGDEAYLISCEGDRQRPRLPKSGPPPTQEPFSVLQAECQTVFDSFKLSSAAP